MEITKVCAKCETEKSLNEFHKNKCSKSGYQYSCKTCANIKAKEFRQKYTSLRTREIKDKKVCGRCNEEKNATEYTKNRCCKDGLDSECRNCKCKRYNAYSKARKQYDPEFRLLTNLRSRLSEALKCKSKSQTTMQLIGADFETFAKWIKFQFEEGMTIENYGSVWHYDHVLPLSSFNLLDEEELQQAMNWLNIRPMTPIKNIQKSNKVDWLLYVLQEVKAQYFLKHLEEI